MIDHWHGCSFDWLAWHGGSLLNLGVQYNSYHVRHMAHKIRQYAIAWCRGDQVICRPKPGRVAVMFLKDDFQFWTHLLEEEFRYCFPDIDL